MIKMKNMFLKVWRYVLFLILLLIMVLIIFQGSFLSKKYLNPWDKNYHTQFKDPRIKIVAHGLLAPNAHNMQSWRIVLDKENKLKFKLFLDENRLLPETDIYHRQSVISQGTFLELVKISAKNMGYKINILIYPDGEIGNEPTKEEIHNTPTAEIELIQDKKVNDPIYNAIFNRVTTRTNYLDRPLSKEQLDKIYSLNNYPDIKVLIFQNSDELKYLKGLIIGGIDIESNLPKTMNESSIVMRYSEYQKNKYGYGLTVASQGNSKIKQFFIESIGSVFSFTPEQEGKVWRDTEIPKIQKTPAYIMLLSNKNDRKTQVEIGMLYARIQLEGTNLGLSMQPTMQITQEYDEVKKLYEDVSKTFADNGQTIQMLFRVGEAEKQVEHSPRMDVLKIISDL
jgi:hypothetical protein